MLLAVFFRLECRIISTAAPEVVTFKANKDLKPGTMEWANYVKVIMGYRYHIYSADHRVVVLRTVVVAVVARQLFFWSACVKSNAVCDNRCGDKQ